MRPRNVDYFFNQKQQQSFKTKLTFTRQYMVVLQGKTNPDVHCREIFIKYIYNKDFFYYQLQIKWNFRK